METNELTGAALNWAVAMAEGLPKAMDSSGFDGPVVVCGFEQEMLHSQYRKGQEWKAYQPSTDWAHGGPIIDRERLSVSPYSFNNANPWVSHSAEGDKTIVGPTPLVAAMRCYVASKLGNEVDVPEEIK